VLTGADRIYKNQQLIVILLDAKTVTVLIEDSAFFSK
jgi:hypothetical protein